MSRRKTMSSSTTRAVSSRIDATPCTDSPTPSGYIELRSTRPQLVDGAVERGRITVPVVAINQLWLGAR
jgi:hypothetical protein